MARTRTAPRKRRKTAAATRTQAAPKPPAPPSDGRLTDQALRAHVRKSKPALYNILAPFRTLEDE